VGGGGFVWVQQDRAGRVAEANRGVEAALADASRLRGRAAVAGDLLSWGAALSAAQKADAVARSAEADGTARAGAESFLARVQSEADGAKAAFAREERNRAMLARLEGIRERSADEDRSDPAASDAAYGAAFREFGIDPDALAPEEAKARLLGTGTAVPLAFALDDWALVRRQAGRGASGEDRRLSRLAAEVDPDPWRRRLREAGNDRAALRALAAAAEAADAPFEGLVRLGEALGDAGERDGAVALLLAAWPRHPDDFWCNYTLARLVRKSGRSGEDEPFLRAALALRPGSGEVRIVWASSRLAAGDDEGARGLLEAAAAASPGDGHILAHLAFVLRGGGPFPYPGVRARRGPCRGGRRRPALRRRVRVGPGRHGRGGRRRLVRRGLALAVALAGARLPPGRA
jgi:hypothetical protein